MALTFALAQLLRKVPGNACMNNGLGSHAGLVPPLTLPLTHAALQRLFRFRTWCHGLPKDSSSQFSMPRRVRYTASVPSKLPGNC